MRVAIWIVVAVLISGSVAAAPLIRGSSKLNQSKDVVQVAKQEKGEVVDRSLVVMFFIACAVIAVMMFALMLRWKGTERRSV
jgi:heme/copper-type cytochrome/quinol oxidase subunit 2